MPRVTFNALAKKKASTRRKRTSTITKARYKPKTVRANRSLIKSNAYAIRSIRRLMPKPVWCDWQYSATQFADAPDTSFSETLKVAQLMSPSTGGSPLWKPVLRQDENVQESSATKVLRMSINMRYRLGVSNWCQYSIFIVSIRKDAADRVINQASLVKGQDYITNLGDDFGVRLNPSIFRVLYTRQISLTKNAWVSPAFSSGGSELAGNPMTTFAKGQVNLKLGYNLRQPVLGTPWTAMNQSQLMPQQRLFLLSFMVQQTDTPDPNNVARVNFDSLYTTYNSG